MEIAALAHLFQVSIHVYSWVYFDDTNVFHPEYFGNGHPQYVALLYEQDFSSTKGGGDHYDLIVADQFWKWRDCMRAMPLWKKDIDISHSLAGRGLKSLRGFNTGKPIQWYDGHRTDVDGNLVFERTALTELFRQRNFNYGSVAFHDTHAVRLGRRQSMDVLIDGYPLTLPCFDNEPWLGRGALANSGSLQDSKMKMIWVEVYTRPAF